MLIINNQEITNTSDLIVNNKQISNVIIGSKEVFTKDDGASALAGFGGWNKVFDVKNGTITFNITEDYANVNSLITTEMLVLHPTGRYIIWTVEDPNYEWFMTRDTSDVSVYDAYIYDSAYGTRTPTTTQDGTGGVTYGCALWTDVPRDYITRTNWNSTFLFWFDRTGPNSLIVSNHTSYPTTLGYESSITIYTR